LLLKRGRQGRTKTALRERDIHSAETSPADKKIDFMRVGGGTSHIARGRKRASFRTIRPNLDGKDDGEDQKLHSAHPLPRTKKKKISW